MTPDPELKRLDLSLPARPDTVCRLQALMARDDSTAGQLAEVVAADLSLAAALIRAVNSAMFGVLRRVETLHEAVVYLGMREVAALTCELGLRRAFPASPAMDALWDRAGRRGRAMASLAASLGVHAWRAQTVGLFAELGVAALMAHDPRGHALAEQRARQGWEAAQVAQAALASMPEPGADQPATPWALLAEAEQRQFGVNHAVLGSALCRAWGMAAVVADVLRDRPWPLQEWPRRSVETRSLQWLAAAVDAALQPVEPPPAWVLATPSPLTLSWAEVTAQAAGLLAARP